MASTLLHLGDNCQNCGESVQTHLQNPFGIKMIVYGRDSVAREMMCNNFVDKDGVSVSRNELFERASR
jgi:hypothetical protein